MDSATHPLWTVIGLRSDVTGDLMVAGVVDGDVPLRDSTGSSEPGWSRWAYTYEAPDADTAAELAEADCAENDD